MFRIRSFDKRDARAAYERQKGVCPYCGKHFELEEMQADHIVPWSKGWRTVPDNCQMLCRDCNLSKGARQGGETMAFGEDVPYEVTDDRMPSLTIDGMPVRRVGITLTGAGGEQRSFSATWEEVAWTIADDMLGQGGFNVRR